MYFRLYNELPIELTTRVLQNIVQLCSLRRTLFSNPERQTYLAHIVKGVKGIMEQPDKLRQQVLPGNIAFFNCNYSQLKCIGGENLIVYGQHIFSIIVLLLKASSTVINVQSRNYLFIILDHYCNTFSFSHFVEFDRLSDLYFQESFHEFCRIVSRLKGNYQLIELMKVEEYSTVIALLADFTEQSLRVGFRISYSVFKFRDALTVTL